MPEIIYKTCAICGGRVLWIDNDISLPVACGHHEYFDVIHKFLKPSWNGVSKKYMLVAANRYIAVDFAKQNNLRDWFYLSRPEIALGINNLLVIVISGYEKNKNYLAIQKFLNYLKKWDASLGITWLETQPNKAST